MFPSIEMVDANIEKSVEEILSMDTFSVKIWPEKDLSSVLKFSYVKRFSMDVTKSFYVIETLTGTIRYPIQNIVDFLVYKEQKCYS